MSDDSTPSPDGYPVTPPYAAPAPQPYGAPATPPYGGAPTAPPYGVATPQSYGAPAPQPYGASAPQPYGSPALQPYGAATPQPYAAQGYASPYAQPAYAPVRPNSGLAITSLVCGIGGLVLFWLYAPVIASVVAVITGHRALAQIRRDPQLGGRGMAITGLITGYAGVAFVLVQVLLAVLAIVFFGAFTLPFLVNR